ncbi:DUF4760 domain-containing protein [Merismopedia glauca]|nr:DUF4760 domain-containing protein [Merismopedia glauca]
MKWFTKKKRFELSRWLVSILLSFAVGWIVAVEASGSPRDDKMKMYDDGSKILTTFTVIVGFIVAAQEVKLNRQKAAHEFFINSILGKVTEIREQLKDKIDTKELIFYEQAVALGKLKPDGEDKILMRTLLNYLDYMCIAIQQGIVDEEIAFNSAKYVLFNTWKWFYPYIKEIRQKQGMKDAWNAIDEVLKDWAGSFYQKVADRQKIIDQLHNEFTYDRQFVDEFAIYFLTILYQNKHEFIHIVDEVQLHKCLTSLSKSCCSPYILINSSIRNPVNIKDIQDYPKVKIADLCTIAYKGREIAKKLSIPDLKEKKDFSNFSDREFRFNFWRMIWLILGLVVIPISGFAGLYFGQDQHLNVVANKQDKVVENYLKNMIELMKNKDLSQPGQSRILARVLTINTIETLETLETASVESFYNTQIAPQVTWLPFLPQPSNGNSDIVSVLNFLDSSKLIIDSNNNSQSCHKNLRELYQAERADIKEYLNCALK